MTAEYKEICRGFNGRTWLEKVRVVPLKIDKDPREPRDPDWLLTAPVEEWLK